ncbi:cysteine hydrolase family protein [Sphingomonas jatrophae]|uniref:Nicotinamidase-related amidase n=1 Tax=Sphingomonas jatrophae TaxID=1166337 RepID=A0A1I6KHU5_9SPHN|nr:isochorismatase family cysteine hydrolase [Sphingomonas jatrophae]SFR90440.1 Nicotinamidase-related amidase [Sphingomonas jatrophae]
MATGPALRTALIVNECQRGVIERGVGAFAGLIDEVEARGIVPRIAALAAAFRAAGQPVVHAPVAHRADFADVQANTLLGAMARKHRRMVAGSTEAAFVSALEPAAEDIVVGRSSGLIAFNGTSLDAVLRRMGVGRVVLAGVSTNVAITGCAMAAADLGYHVLVAEDCIAASDPVTHATIVREQLRMIARIVSADEAAAALVGGGQGD